MMKSVLRVVDSHSLAVRIKILKSKQPSTSSPPALLEYIDSSQKSFNPLLPGTRAPTSKRRRSTRSYTCQVASRLSRLSGHVSGLGRLTFIKF